MQHDQTNWISWNSHVFGSYARDCCTGSTRSRLSVPDKIVTRSSYGSDSKCLGTDWR